MQKIIVNTESKSYPVYIGEVTDIKLNGIVLLVTTEQIAKLYLDKFSKIIKSDSLHVCIIPDGEEVKNMQYIEKILDSAFKAKLNRNSTMVALGGGVITDMVGFASGIYQRGIDFISIPTTLLAMVDASVGGKCGINNSYGKNLVGLFHQPNAVFVDTSFLETLPKREFGAGVAEIIKIFACFEFELLHHFSLDNINSYIHKSIELKALVVKRDENERSGLRALLNFGHTFGHAIELEGNFKKYLHGEAVSMGMIMANKLSNKLGLLPRKYCDILESLLLKCELPIKYKIENVTNFYNSFFLDKKSLDSKLHFVLLEYSNERIAAKLHNNIEKEAIMEVLNGFS